MRNQVTRYYELDDEGAPIHCSEVIVDIVDGKVVVRDIGLIDFWHAGAGYKEFDSILHPAIVETIKRLILEEIERLGVGEFEDIEEEGNAE